MIKHFSSLHVVEGHITNDKITINLQIAMLDAKQKVMLSFAIYIHQL